MNQIDQAHADMAKMLAKALTEIADVNAEMITTSDLYTTELVAALTIANAINEGGSCTARGTLMMFCEWQILDHQFTKNA